MLIRIAQLLLLGIGHRGAQHFLDDLRGLRAAYTSRAGQRVGNRLAANQIDQRRLRLSRSDPHVSEDGFCFRHSLTSPSSVTRDNRQSRCFAMNE